MGYLVHHICPSPPEGAKRRFLIAALLAFVYNVRRGNSTYRFSLPG